MTRIVRAADLIGTPVATLETAVIVGEVKDILFDPLRSRFLGFTLRGRGLLSPPFIGVLPAAGIRALGRDALMIGSEAVLVREAADVQAVLGEKHDVVGTEAFTDEGDALGKVSDIVLESDGHTVNVVGYSIERPDGHELIVPATTDSEPNWGEALVVPAGVERLGAEGLIGFREALERTRALRSSARP